MILWIIFIRSHLTEEEARYIGFRLQVTQHTEGNQGEEAWSIQDSTSTSTADMKRPALLSKRRNGKGLHSLVLHRSLPCLDALVIAFHDDDNDDDFR
jgi:hypothetical protein